MKFSSFLLPCLLFILSQLQIFKGCVLCSTKICNSPKKETSSFLVLLAKLVSVKNPFIEP